MEFCRKAITIATLSALTFPSFATHYLPNQFEIMLGYNHSFHSNNKLHFEPTNTEIDSLHETGSGNDIIGGLSYGYNILPWFVAYHGKDLSHSALQRVWVGLDLIFMNTTETGDVYVSQDPALDEFNFEFTENTARLMVNSEVDFNSPWKNVFPFVQASVGAARIAATYEDTPNPGFFGGGISLSEEVNYNLVYSLGAGIKFLVKPNLQVGASYLFTDFGIVKAKQQSNGIYLSEPLKDHLYTSSALLNISFLF